MQNNTCQMPVVTATFSPPTPKLTRDPCKTRFKKAGAQGNAKQHLPDASGQCDFQHLCLGQLTNQNLGQAV